MTPILVCSTKYIHPWFIEFVVFKHCTEQLMERLYVIGFLIFVIFMNQEIHKY